MGEFFFQRKQFFASIEGGIPLENLGLDLTVLNAKFHHETLNILLN